MGKTPGSGRKPGTPNKKTLILVDKLEQEGIDAIKIIQEALQGLDDVLCFDPDSLIAKYRTKAQIGLELLSYIYPKRKAIETIEVTSEPAMLAKKTFSEFCEAAGYPKPFPKQIEMMDFGLNETVPRMILGARGYGKTDYITMLGTAYCVYLNPMELTFLIITKSKSRNTAIINEIANALVKNGVQLEKQNSTCVKVAGHIGKDYSVEAMTIKTSMRGRHPKVTVMDDPVTEEDVSEAMRVLVKRKYNEVMKLCSNVIVIGQPAHKHDLYAELSPMIKTMEVPYGTIPELDHDLEAQRLAGVDEASIQASYFLKITSEGSSPFEKVKYIDTFPGGLTSVAFIDPSDGGDHTAVSIFRMIGQGVAVVGFSWKKRWDYCVPDMMTAFRKYGVSKLCFETNKHGNQPLDYLRTEFKDNNLPVGVQGRYSNGNKHSRIMSAGTLAHLIHISKESGKDYINQVVKYELGAKIDDAPDSLATGLEWLGLIRGKQ